MITDLVKFWPVLVGAVALVGFFYVADYRLSSVETQLERVDLKELSREVRVLKCETRNIKRVLRQQSEVDCD